MANNYQLDTTKLLHSFQDACANQDFKKFVYKLDIPEETLMKYTSNLEDSFLENEHCKNCKSLEECQNKVPGYCFKPFKSGRVITFSYEACDKMNHSLKENQYKSNIEVFELSEDIKNASLKEIYKDDKARVPIIKYFKEFVTAYLNGEKPKGMYLYGSFGSGKTYLISALFNELAKKGIFSALVYYPRFLQLLKAAFQTDYDELLEHIMKIPLLLLDDIGAEKVSDWSRDEVLGIILQYRMENHLPTFFTSNLTLEELEKSLSITSTGVDKVKARRIVERIKQLTVYYELISKNRRV
ncbi:MAG: primosomal protein DnaI [Bacilli bacterium]|nr:primosomal protein DnaI [Bacilli bacterium]